MLIKKLSTYFILIIAGITASTLASATTLIKMDFNNIIHNASVCVVAQVKESTTTRVNGAVQTHTTFSVKDIAFGKTDKTITVVTPGGRITNGKIPMVEVSAGTPRFFVGTKNILLINQKPNSNTYNIVGFNQGVFNVLENNSGSFVQLPRSQGGATPVDAAMELIRRTRNQPAN